MEIRTLEDWEKLKLGLLTEQEHLWLAAGKLIMAWAQIEQLVDSGIDMIRREMGWAGLAVDPVVPDYFRKRAAYFHDLVCKLSANPQVHRRARHTFGTISRLKRVREAFAHGNVTLRPGSTDLRVHLGPSQKVREQQREKERARLWKMPAHYIVERQISEDEAWEWSLGPSMPFARLEADIGRLADIQWEIRSLPYEIYRGLKTTHPDKRLLAFLEATGRALTD